MTVTTAVQSYWIFNHRTLQHNDVWTYHQLVWSYHKLLKIIHFVRDAWFHFYFKPLSFCKLKCVILYFFQVATGREWYIHTIYTVRSRENANRGIGKRSLEYHSVRSTNDDLTLSRSRRATAGGLPEIADGIGAENNRGTNIMHIALDRNKRRAESSKEVFAKGLETSELNTEEEEEGLVTVVGALVGLLLTVLITVIIVLVLRSRQKNAKEGWSEGVREVVKGSVSTEPMLVVRMQGCHNSSEVWALDMWMDRWTMEWRVFAAFYKKFSFFIFNWY